MRGDLPEFGSTCVQPGLSKLSSRRLWTESRIVLDEVQADVSLGVHVGVVAGREELHCGSILRVATGGTHERVHTSDIYILC